MLIVKPYGRSRSILNKENEFRRTIHLNIDPDTPVDLTDFAENHSELIIAQWISAIDKIASKPIGREKPTTEQRRFRNELGRAAFDLLINDNLLPDFTVRSKELERLWWAKIHPYGKGDEEKKKRSSKGRWYARFANDPDVSKVDAVSVANKIHEHLYGQEYRIKADRSNKREVRISSRARSITKNVLVPLTTYSNGEKAWSDQDKEYYVAAGDIAGQIHQAALRDEANQRRKFARKSGFSMRHAAPLLFAQYGRLFKGENGDALSIAEARTAFPGIFALHGAIRDTYTRTLKGHNKKIVARILPKNMAALFDLVEAKSDNRELNALVRLGKVIHYEATPPLGQDTPGNIVDNWPADITQSRYWTSEGQSEIKRNEAFVRVWRSVIALASRTLTDWADPSGQLSGDILGRNEIRQAVGPGFDETGYDQKIPLLFSNRADLFSVGDTDFKKEVLKFALTGIRDLRHGTFHFKGRGGFANALKGAKDSIGPESQSAARALWQADAAGRTSRLRAVMRGAHFEYYFNDERNYSLFAAISDVPRSHAPLPRFRRVLLRADNAWRQKDFELRLPAPGNRSELEDPARLCQYTALKFLYERAFPSWLDGRSADELNSWIDRAVTRSTGAARTINKDEYAASKATGLVRLRGDENIDHFFDRMSAATATEFRVQRGYDPDPENAQKQSKYLDDLRCDVVGQSFEHYLKAAGFGWLLDDFCGEPLADAPISDLDALPDSAGEEPPQDWQTVIYFLIHLVPVEEVGRLLHQLRKWTVLEGRPSEDAQAVEEVFGLYLDMHDAKFEGGAAFAGAEALIPLFESEDLFSLVFPKSGDDEDDGHIPRRGLREMLRFGNLNYLMPVFQEYKIAERDITGYLESERKEGGTSPVANAQSLRQDLHAKWVKERGRYSNADKTAYCKALATVIRHRLLAAHVTLTNHVRLHRLMMQVLGRLVDYAGLWERDLYFVTLALIHLDGKTPGDVFKSVGDAGYPIATGQIVRALRNINNTPVAATVSTGLKRLFGNIYLDGRIGKVRIRNDLAHFNILRDRERGLNLTDMINDARKLVSHDRKLKNAVSKSIIELLHREGLELSWKIAGHDLTGAELKTRQAIHIGEMNIKENLHGEAFVAMAAALFGGKAPKSDDISTADIDRIASRQQQRSKPKGGRKKHRDNRGNHRGKRNI